MQSEMARVADLTTSVVPKLKKYIVFSGFKLLRKYQAIIRNGTINMISLIFPQKTT